MKLFSKKKKEKSLGLVFDIGSGSVAGALVETGKDKAKVIYAKRMPLKILPVISAERLEKEILKLLTEVSHNLLKEGLKNLKLTDRDHNNLESCHIFLASPWYYPKIKTFNQNKSEPFVVTKELIDSIVDEEAFSDEEKIFEKKIISIKLNGYQTENPHKKKTKELEIALLEGVGEQSFLAKVEEIIERDFTLVKMHFHSFIASLFSLTRDLENESKDFLLVDITAEVTEISLVKDGVINDNASFPKGRNFFLRKISESMGTSPHQSLSTLNSFLAGGQKDGKVKTVLSEAKSAFLRDFSTSLSEFKKNTSIPRKIFLTVDEGFSEWFSEVISEEEFIQGGLIGENFVIKAFNQGALNPYLSQVRSFDKDIFLSIEAIFLNKIFELEE